ncbi:ROK family protein [Marinigracilibium pacificum]|uniref:ROK family protein n=1 Tax=Marinigracilibium pacificum TaxID=2729599 RepID=A0A848J1F0_9BACT|nr:ROK family protein [Marinigracilibium pacificum]NMM48370.1 ROK family protein [Marinigracilibium pacificum]
MTYKSDKACHYIGIDLGGTKIEGILITKNESIYEVKRRIRVPTEREKGYDHILNQISYLVNKLRKESPEAINKIGICTPGTFDPDTGSLNNSNTTCLNGKNIKHDLSTSLDIEVLIENDANCFTLAEATMGALSKLEKKPNVVFGVILGTGVGGGIFINEKSLSGKNGIAGEWGHNFLDNSGGSCYCGKVGCVETVISGVALESYYHSISGKIKSLAEIVQLHDNETDQQAKQTIKRLTTYFGKALAQVINILDPDAIVLGGGVSNIPYLYTDGVNEIKKHLFNDDLKTPILKPELGDSAGVFGAAALTMM